MNWRTKLFATAAPADWIPRVGETLVLRRKRGTVGNLVAKAKCVGVFDDIVKIKVQYGRRFFEKTLLLIDVRPEPHQPKLQPKETP